MGNTKLTTLLILVLCAASTCWAVLPGTTYSGDLSHQGGGVTGVAGCNWLTDNPRISWAVTWTGAHWDYSYKFSVDKPGAISFLIIEVSPNFTCADMWDFEGFRDPCIGQWSLQDQSSNWGMPVGGVYGIKMESFEPIDETQYAAISFSSARAPVWGDFYAKDGKVSREKNACWNVGFVDNDTDPSASPQNGSVQSHILRPDTKTTPGGGTIPEAATVVLGPSGLALLVALERHRRRYERIREGISLGYYMAKRAVDMILSCFALLVTAPLFALIALLVRIDSRGPILFRRMVVGKDGQVFGMLKFRTMVVDAERILEEDDKLKEQYYANNCKLKDDPRVTRLGRFLRKTSLDELPQFINILNADMTFVGPRPIAEDEVHMYGPEVERFKTVTPGITGLWQTRGRSEISYGKRVEMDMLYIKHRSLKFDIWIVLCTLPAVLLKRGAF